MGWIVGAVINVTGSIMINLGTNITKLGHNQTAAVAPLQPPSLLRQPADWFRFPGKKWFFCGMCIFATGNLLNFASFGFAAQSLLAALGVVQFLSNMVFARFLNNEHITKRVMFATGLVVTGCILLVSFGNHESPIITAHDLLRLYAAPPYITYLICMAGIVFGSYLMYRRGKRAIGGLKVQRVIHGPWARWLPIFYALFSGVLGTQSVLYGKALSSLLRTTLSGDSQLGFWYTWLALVLFMFFAAFWLTRYSKALRLFPVSIMMPILQIVWVLFSILSGSLYYQEYKTLNALSGSMFALGVVVLLVGIAFLTSGQRPVQELELELAEPEGNASPDTTPMAKMGSNMPLVEGSLRQKYSSSQGDEGAGAGANGDSTAIAAAAKGGGHPLHGRQASDDVGLRLISGSGAESSSAVAWADPAAAQEAGMAAGPAVVRVLSGNKKPVLAIHVESPAGEEASPASRTGSQRGSTSFLEEHDMNTNVRQYFNAMAGLDLVNPLSPAFTSFSMPLVPAVSNTPRLTPTALSHLHGAPLSARGPRPRPSPPPPGHPGVKHSHHRIQRSRSAGELSEMLAKAGIGAPAEAVGPHGGEGGMELAASVHAARQQSPRGVRHIESMPPIRAGSPVDRSRAASPPPTAPTVLRSPGGGSSWPKEGESATPPPSGARQLGGSGAAAGGSSVPRLSALGTVGGARRAWSITSERGTPAPPLGLSLDTSFSFGGDPGDAPGSTSSTKPPRQNPLSPRVFLEPLSPHSEERAREDLSQLLAAQKGKND